MTRSPACRMVRTSSPCAVPNPVRTTTQTHPLSGSLPTLTPPAAPPPPPPPLADPCSARSTLCPRTAWPSYQSRYRLAFRLAAPGSIARLRWGVDSPMGIFGDEEIPGDEHEVRRVHLLLARVVHSVCVTDTRA